MLIKTASTRLAGKEIFIDSGLVNQEGKYCLCTKCKKTKVYSGEEAKCEKHDKFIAMTNSLELVAPIFGCAEFEGRESQPDYLDWAIQHESERGKDEFSKWVCLQAAKVLSK